MRSRLFTFLVNTATHPRIFVAWRGIEPLNSSVRILHEQPSQASSLCSAYENPFWRLNVARQAKVSIEFLLFVIFNSRSLYFHTYFKRVIYLSILTYGQQYLNTTWELRLLFQGIKPYIMRLGRWGSTEYWSSLSTEISLLGPNFGLLYPAVLQEF